jgi:hypothetical protein
MLLDVRQQMHSECWYPQHVTQHDCLYLLVHCLVVIGFESRSIYIFTQQHNFSTPKQKKNQASSTFPKTLPCRRSIFRCTVWCRTLNALEIISVSVLPSCDNRYLFDKHKLGIKLIYKDW